MSNLSDIITGIENIIAFEITLHSFMRLDKKMQKYTNTWNDIKVITYKYIKIGIIRNYFDVSTVNALHFTQLESYLQINYPSKVFKQDLLSHRYYADTY